jgi:hypothetical protein
MILVKDLKRKIELIMLIFGKDAKVKEVIQIMHS